MNLSGFYVSASWPIQSLAGDLTLDGVPCKDLLDPHPDFLHLKRDLGGSIVQKSIGTSLFLGPRYDRSRIGPGTPYYCPESVKWNRPLYYAMEDPRLFDVLPEGMQQRIEDCLVVGIHDGQWSFGDPLHEGGPYDGMDGVPGVWSIWGRCHPDGPLRCLDVHECVDLRYEMSMHHAMLEEARHHGYEDDYFWGTTDDRDGTTMFGIYYEPGTVFSMERRSKAISNWHGLIVRPVAMHLGGQRGDKLLREAVEAQMAWEWKAVYWNRTYFQAVTQRMLRSQLQVENVMKKK